HSSGRKSRGASARTHADSTDCSHRLDVQFWFPTKGGVVNLRSRAGQRGRYDTTDRPIGVKPIVPEHRDRNVDFDVVESLESLRMMVITASAATGLVWNRSSQPLRVCWRPLFHTGDGRLSERGFRRGTYEPRNRFYR